MYWNTRCAYSLLSDFCCLVCLLFLLDALSSNVSSLLACMKVVRADPGGGTWKKTCDRHHSALDRPLTVNEGHHSSHALICCRGNVWLRAWHCGVWWRRSRSGRDPESRADIVDWRIMSVTCGMLLGPLSRLRFLQRLAASITDGLLPDPRTSMTGRWLGSPVIW